MRKIISLGHGCWQKIMIRELDKKDNNQESDVFDWMKSFNFTKLVESLENDFKIFEKEDIVEFKDLNAFYNKKYDFYLPHDEEYFKDKSELIRKYKRRLERLSKYQQPIVIREINFSNSYSVKDTKIADFKNNDIVDDYSEENYERIMKFLPRDSTIILFSSKPLEKDVKDKIGSKFVLIDNCYDFQESLRFKPDQLKNFKIFFEAISKNVKNIDKISRVIKR